MIINLIALGILFSIIYYKFKQEIIEYNYKQIKFNEDKVNILNSNINEYYDVLIEKHELLKQTSQEKANQPCVINVLETCYKEEQIEKFQNLKKKYYTNFEKEKHLIYEKVFKELFEKDINKIFKNYYCNNQELDITLNNFFLEYK